MTGRRPPELDEAPEFPDLLFDLWRWFLDLNAGRQSGMSASPISEAEIRAYQLNRGIRMAGWELTAIRRLDGVALASVSDDAKKESNDH